MNLQSLKAADAQIEWSDDDKGRITDVIVFDPKYTDRRQRDRFGARFENSHGRCVGDWLSGKRASSTPDGVFSGMMRVGFSDEETLLSALEQFGKIDEAAWARAMAEEIREHRRMRYDEELVTPVYGSAADGKDGKPYYVGHQWKVDAEGIDTIDESYFIERDRLGELYYPDRISSWPPHLAEKTWVDLKDLEAAFRVALRVHEGAYQPLPEGALERGLDLAREMIERR